MSQLYLVCPRCVEGYVSSDGTHYRDVCPWCVRGFVEAAEWTTDKYAAMQKRVRELLTLIHDVAAGEAQVDAVAAYYEQHKGDCLNSTAVVRAERESSMPGGSPKPSPRPPANSPTWRRVVGSGGRGRTRDLSNYTGGVRWMSYRNC